nr:hypothetical protein [Sodalis glossinidius]
MGLDAHQGMEGMKIAYRGDGEIPNSAKDIICKSNVSPLGSL